MEEEAKRFQNYRLSQILPSYLTQALLVRRAVFHKIGTFDTGLKFADAMAWFLRAIHQGLVMELLLEASGYRQMHRANASMESDTDQMTMQMQEALLKVSRDSLLRLRAQDGNASRIYQFPSSGWNK